MLSNIILSIVIISELMTGSYFLGRYVSSVNEIFVNNTFATWALGLITNLFVTFTVFFVFAWFKPPIIYNVIIFLIKELILYTFLIIKRDRITNKIDFKNIGIIVAAGLLITIVYNYGMDDYTGAIEKMKGPKFSTWFELKNTIGSFSKIPSYIINEWILSIVVGSTAFTIVAAFIREISKGDKKYIPYLSLGFTLIILGLMGPAVRLEDSLGFFLILFMLSISIRLIIYSRRRYAAQFGITSFVAWTIDINIFVAATAIAFITTIVYTFLKKARASLFWAQLVLPQVIMLLLQSSGISIGVIIPLFVVTVFLYGFMLSTRRMKFFSKVNAWVIKYRVIIPICIFCALFLTSIIVISTQPINIGWMEMKTTSSTIFNNYNNNIGFGVFQIIAWIVILIYAGWRILKIFKSEKNIHWSEFIMIFAILLTLFVYNPFMDRMLESVPSLANQMSRVGIVAVVPVLLLFSTQTINNVTKYVKNI